MRRNDFPHSCAATIFRKESPPRCAATEAARNTYLGFASLFRVAVYVEQPHRESRHEEPDRYLHHREERNGEQRRDGLGDAGLGHVRHQQRRQKYPVDNLPAPTDDRREAKSVPEASGGRCEYIGNRR